ncbi:hypothetical protein [Mesorhizobium sp.]|uniref:hypothetical protein n=1 Tax=Mesorhizobium sp. TaxID=1871066 RepID=UPI000FE87716|nr:hypothetical protein [Mesorhizobium sp.]RWH52399.1 MAG: hypothetical protein EOQ82_26195 [Mesorhizobium sp.]RWK38288.1 MAG: hypothetical protein EOR46_24325 [Mesorhizobium sp.]RWK48904.1 MAG: hypothetical protein EOR47_16430 [Mesorhizobium sp.]TIO05069.1 MAG: hypothetical protein E5X88_28785 [Mesorhizobium sp.]TIP43169.1 MAG: hypothetical protein E5X62_19730 [Mesorhizobium sp.]
MEAYEVTELAPEEASTILEVMLWTRAFGLFWLGLLALTIAVARILSTSLIDTVILGKTRIQ